MNGWMLKLDTFRLVRNYNYLISKASDHWKNLLRTTFNSLSEAAFDLRLDFQKRECPSSNKH